MEAEEFKKNNEGRLKKEAAERVEATKKAEETVKKAAEKVEQAKAAE